VRLLGSAHGNGLHRLAFGMDERPVENDRETKSISAERTFAVDITGREAHSAELDVVFGHARRRLMRHGGGARTVRVEARFGAFPGLDVLVPGLGAGWVVAIRDTRLTVRIEGPQTPPGKDHELELGRDEILRQGAPPVCPVKPG